MGVADDAPVLTNGVTPIDRMREFNPHPSGGKWAEQKLHFDEGVDISKAKYDRLMEFIDGERKTPHQKVGLDFLPPIVRDGDA